MELRPDLIGNEDKKLETTANSLKTLPKAISDAWEKTIARARLESQEASKLKPLHRSKSPVCDILEGSIVKSVIKML